jgi:hypothetical protein
MNTALTIETRPVAAPDMPVENPIPLLEEILAPWQEQVGADFSGYKNHVYRVLHFCFALHECTENERHKLTIAGAFHDLGIWSQGTVDYLPPSIELAMVYLRQNNLDSWCQEIALIIDLHHKLRAYTGVNFRLVEVFRKADLADFSLGLMKGGIPSATIRKVKAAFPNAGFHKRLMQLAGGWFAKHPVSPPPFLKW